MKTDIKNPAQSKNSYQGFVQQIVASEVVWALASSEGLAVAESNDDYPLDILLFWSDEGRAKKVQAAAFSNCDESKITLFDFMYGWLPGMSEAGVLAGANWTGRLVGPEIQPFALQKELESALSDEQMARFKKITMNGRACKLRPQSS